MAWLSDCLNQRAQEQLVYACVHMRMYMFLRKRVCVCRPTTTARLLAYIMRSGVIHNSLTVRE